MRGQDGLSGGPNAALFGRERELKLLLGLVDDIHQRGQAMLIRGEAGIGKSSLVSATGDRARETGLQILTTAGVQSETRLPFAGLHQLLRPVLSDIDRLPHPQRSALHAAFGISAGVAPDLFLIALATLNLLADAAAQTPLLLVCEDAHWLDQPTSDVLGVCGEANQFGRDHPARRYP